MFIRVVCPAMRLSVNSLFDVQRLGRTSFTLIANRYCFTGKSESVVKDTCNVWRDKYRRSEYFLELFEKERRISLNETCNNIASTQTSQIFTNLYELLLQASTDASVNLDDEKYKTFFVKEVYDELHQLPNEALVTTLRLIVDIRKLHKYPCRASRIAGIIDQIFYENLKKKPILLYNDFKEAMEVSRLLCAVDHGRSSPLVELLFLKSAIFVKSMDVTEFWSFMYLIFSRRKSVNDINLQKDIELKFAELLPQLTIEQCAVICGAFRESNMKLRSIDLFDNLVSFVCDHDDLFYNNNIGLPWVLMSLKHSVPTLNAAEIDKLLNKCKLHIQNLNVVAVRSIFDLLLRYECYRPDILELGFSVLLQNLKDVKIIDIEKIFLCFAYFNHKPKQLKEMWPEIESVIMGLSVTEKYEILAHRFEECLRQCLVLGIYPQRLIDLVFGEKMQIRDGKDKSNLETYLMMHSCLLIEAPEKYTKVISEPIIQYITTKFRELPNLKANNVYFEEWQKNLKSLFPGLVITSHVLPFLRSPDILIFDNVTIAEKSRVESNGVTCVVILYRSSFADRSCRRLKGIAALKLRLLLKLGYKLYSVPFFADKLTSKKELEFFRVLENKEWAFSNEYVL